MHRWQARNFYPAALLLVVLSTGLWPSATLAANATQARPQFENANFRLRLNPRSREQITAFYTGRGFPKTALDELRQVCFITVGLRNLGKQTVWLDLTNWKLSTKNGPLKRILRQDWRQRWTRLGLAQRFQSTFRWTLMPEKLGFYPYEGEGGNITLPYTPLPITLQARIEVGDNERKVFDIKLDNIRCSGALP